MDADRKFGPVRIRLVRSGCAGRDFYGHPYFRKTRRMIESKRMSPCLFCRIVANELPSFRVYEDESVVAFLDIKPVKPGHALVVPKQHSEGLHDADGETLSCLIYATQ